jgi:HEAT repeat protein
LGELQAQAAIPQLVAALSDSNRRVRWQAAEALGKLKAVAAAPTLLTTLGDADQTVRQKAAGALSKLEAPDLVSQLAAALSAPSNWQRAGTAAALGELAAIEAEPQLLAALADSDSWVRTNAARSLGKIAAVSAVPQLINLLGDPESRVRSAAARSLGRIHATEAAQPLLAALADGVKEVRSSAAWALACLEFADAAPLIQAAFMRGGIARPEAAYALGRLRVQSAASVLASVSGTDQADDAFEYARALIHLDPGLALPALARYTRQFRRESRFERLRGYAQQRLGDKDAAHASFAQALDAEESCNNLLALAHLHLEQCNLAAAHGYCERAGGVAPRSALAQASRAVRLWCAGDSAAAFQALDAARNRSRTLIHPRDLAYDEFWGPRAVAALEALLAGEG